MISLNMGLDISSKFQLFSQITSSMAPKFEKLIDAAKSVRTTIQGILDDDDMSQRTPMEECCNATQLSQQASFPNVSAKYNVL